MKEKELTQTEVAELCNFSRTYICSIIAGRSDFSGTLLKALFREGWPVKYIVTGERESLLADLEAWEERALKAEKENELLNFHVERLEKLIKK